MTHEVKRRTSSTITKNGAGNARQAGRNLAQRTAESQNTLESRSPCS